MILHQILIFDLTKSDLEKIKNKTSLTVHVVYDAFSDGTLVNLKWMDGYKSLPRCLEGCIAFDSFRCGSLLSQGLLIKIFYKSPLIFF